MKLRNIFINTLTDGRMIPDEKAGWTFVKAWWDHEERLHIVFHNAEHAWTISLAYVVTIDSHWESALMEALRKGIRSLPTLDEREISSEAGWSSEHEWLRQAA